MSSRRGLNQPVSCPDDRRREGVSTASPTDGLMEKVVNLCKRAGSSPVGEIYGGSGPPMTTAPRVNMLRNVKDAGGARWCGCATTWSASTRHPVAPAIWAAPAPRELHRSVGRLPQVQGAWRPDKIDGSAPTAARRTSPSRGRSTSCSRPRRPVETRARRLSAPRDAQGMFTNFANVLTTPQEAALGIAQVGKSFRNEITPQNFVFRTREFEQMEMSTSSRGRASQWFEYWLAERLAWYRTSGCPTNCSGSVTRGRRVVPLLRQTATSSSCSRGLGRARGRGQPGRLRSAGHIKGSGERLEYFDQSTGSATSPRRRAGPRGDPGHDGLPPGCYAEDEVAGRPGRCSTSTGASRRTRSPSSRCRARRSWPGCRAGSLDAPTALHVRLRHHQSIGRRYRPRRGGDPWCVTIDFDSLEDGAVTVRDRTRPNRSAARSTVAGRARVADGARLSLRPAGGSADATAPVRHQAETHASAIRTWNDVGPPSMRPGSVHDLADR